jgi:hypothetical protein
MNLWKIVFFAPEQAETLTAKGFRALFAEEQEIRIAMKNT